MVGSLIIGVQLRKKFFNKNGETLLTSPLKCDTIRVQGEVLDRFLTTRFDSALQIWRCDGWWFESTYLSKKIKNA